MSFLKKEEKNAILIVVILMVEIVLIWAAFEWGDLFMALFVVIICIALSLTIMGTEDKHSSS